MGRREKRGEAPVNMRYARHMPGLQSPNTCPQKWAAVVSGTVWKRWALSPSGALEAQTVRGPVIVWAKPVHGEEEGPKLEAPKPTPLDLRVWAVNTAAHFEKFRRGKVKRFWKMNTFTSNLLALGRVRFVLAPGGDKVIKQEEGKLKRKARSMALPFAACSKQKEVTGREITRFGEKIKRQKWFKSALRLLEYAALFMGRATGVFAYFITYLLSSLAWAALELRRRVRPAPRRDRVPRPVHTRPRPPSAPLAPPVTC